MRILTLAWVQSQESDGEATAQLVQALAGRKAEVTLVLPYQDGPYLLTGLRVLSADGGAPLHAGIDGTRQATLRGIHAGDLPEPQLLQPGAAPLMAEMACVA